MSRILIIFVVSIFVISSFYLLGSRAIENDSNQFIKKLIPVEIKNTLKKTIFAKSVLKSENNRLKKDLENLKKEKKRIAYYFAYSWLNKNKDKNEIILDTRYYNDPISIAQIKRDEEQIVSQKKSIYSLSRIYMPFPRQPGGIENYAKAGAHIDIHKENLFFALGASDIFILNLLDLQKPNIKIKELKSNFKNFVKSDLFFENSQLTITDILIDEDNIYLAYTDAIQDECAGLYVVKSKINYNYLNFEKFWGSPNDQCSKANLGHGGGRMKISKNKMILTTGDFSTAENRKGQGYASSLDENDFKGKVIEIDLETKNYKFLSMGHRNPQGLFINKKPNLLLTTEHGPKGGDEVNIIRLDKKSESIQNFGWPISSYGDHYDGTFKEWAPLHKSHLKFGFIEPIKYFTPSIAISELIKVDNKFNPKYKNDFYVSSMGHDIQEFDMSIHHMRFDENFDKIIFEDKIILNDRIRDLIQYNNKILLYLEGAPALGILKFIK